ncbi:MAG: DUF87 domain-containing protein [Thermoanaerobaculales bacterium]|jgi:hypothetical protein|nr:DUF87 domain-containing protein [Thermoanaerobaculales bacterium]
MDDRTLHLGSEPGGGPVVGLDADHLTTHAVCLGMTGSGKTGLGIVALEELARRGVPLLVVDLKGDMVDLLLNFPELDAASFAPWVPADEVGDRDRLEVATEVAERWRLGLAGHGLGPGDLASVRHGVEWRLLTPGAATLAPLDIVPALGAPAGWDPDADPDAATDRVNGVAGAILSLVGRGGDPLADRDQVLTASVILEHWRRGEALDLVRLLTSLADPPFEALGALPLDVFYPRDERLRLVMALNTLLASPAFAAWTTGTPLTMEELLGLPGRPRATIVTVAHLDEAQRLFVIGLLVSELVAWMRGQPASSGLRALLYMDEVHGILPPHPASPPTKGPLLTLLKQGRAFGVGAWLATQNPVDLDYKALGNAGVKLIGRLVTDRDRDRALEGLGMGGVSGGEDPAALVARLGKREFLLDDVRRAPRVVRFASRWAMSYLRGPVTLSEMRPLVAPWSGGGETGRAAVEPPARPAAENGAASPPLLEHAVVSRFDPRARGPARPWLLVRSRTLVSRAGLGLHRELEEIWRIPVGEGGELVWEGCELLADVPELAETPPPGMLFPRSAPPRLGAALERIGRDFAGWRSRRPFEALANPALDLVAEAGESREAFIERCRIAADRADDADQARARARFEKRANALETRLARERDELGRDQRSLEARRAEEKLGLVEGLFSVLVGSGSLRTASRRAAGTARTAASKRRMRQSAEGAVTESVNEIERLEAELEELAAELQAEVDRIADESERIAARLETVAVRPVQRDVEIAELRVVWS